MARIWTKPNETLVLALKIFRKLLHRAVGLPVSSGPLIWNSVSSSRSKFHQSEPNKSIRFLVLNFFTKLFGFAVSSINFLFSLNKI